jgi:magnesium-dependent phosphatase-1
MRYYLLLISFFSSEAFAFMSQRPSRVTLVPYEKRKNKRFARRMTLSSSSSSSAAAENNDTTEKKMPKAIIFDLDGCLWSPEMYEILFFQGGRGSPFSRDPDDPLNLVTCGNQPVHLLADIRSVFQQICTNPLYQSIQFGISSRTDEPNWARELLGKFLIPLNNGEGIDGECVNLESIFNGPIVLSKEEKVDHFRRIAKESDIDFSDILFFDNEYRNCESVARLGVSAVYCPQGVTEELWNLGVYKDFPRSDGTVINVDFRW